MTLTEFMKLANISDVELATQVKRDRTNVLRWRTGKTKPDFEALVAIEKISDGKVTARDFSQAAG
jgi:ribosome-binding protein aMBF1 (putative translation factor)